MNISGRKRFLQCEMLVATDDADDFAGDEFGFAFIHLYVFPNGIFVREEFFDERLVNDQDAAGFRGILALEGASGEQRNAHGAEIIAVDVAKIRVFVVVGVCGGMFGDGEESVVGFAAERQFGNEAGAYDRGRGLEAVLERVEEGFARLLGVVARRDEGDFGGEHVRGIEAQMNAHQAPETIEEQAGGDQDDDGERDFGDDQGIVGAMLGARIAGSAAFFQALREVATAGFERGSQAEKYCGENCGDEGESENGAAYVYFIEARKALWAELLQEFHAGIGEKNSSDAAGEREDQAFGEELAEQAGASGAERGANGDLALASGIAREKKAGDIGASNQENQGDRADEDHECRAHVADENVLQRIEPHAPSGVGDGILRGEVSGDGVEFGLSLRDGDAGLEQADGTEEMRAAALHASD